MYFPSITTILGCLFVCYMAHSIWSIAQLFSTSKCTGKPCYGSYLSKNPKLQLVLFSSAAFNPTSSDVTKVANIKNFDWHSDLQRRITIEIPARTRRNGTLYLYATLAETESPSDWLSLQRDELAKSTIRRILITEYAVPKAASFNLLGENAKPDRNPGDPETKPVTHILSKAFITILSDNISVSHLDIPPELGRLIQVHRKHGILPIMQQDFFKTRLMDLVEVDKNLTDLDIEINYSPIGVGKLRLMLQIEHATSMMKQLGFTDRDIDEVKGIFSDTNVYLLCSTLFVGGIHLLFDFLSFKNDVLFWKQKRDYVGLSVRTTLWRGFSQIIVFFYLMDENTSLLVLIPAGIGTVIELWKCKKILKLDLSFRGITIKTSSSTQSIANAEKRTQAFDREAMRYLSYLLYPLCLCGAIYSLVYQPHRSWYSWTINSLVNGVYAFGFLFMLPQLFVNYKLKSVAALPWRAFMYKAFNTFIDDIFAFIITMPTAHRVACFRDDVVFIIYLYQRWLYPVDKNRTDTGFAIEETTAEEETKKSK